MIATVIKLPETFEARPSPDIAQGAINRRYAIEHEV